MPNTLSKKVIEKLKFNKPNKEVLDASEKAVSSWINQYVDEMDQIEQFYKQKMTDLIEKFITLQS